MNSRTAQGHLDQLTMRDAAHAPLTLHAVTLSLTHQNDRLLECRLTVRVTPELYDQIDRHALFNLSPEVRHSFSAGEFLPEVDLAIEMSLKPDELPHLEKYAGAIDRAISYLLQLNLEQPDDCPLLMTENWLALTVKQQQAIGETGYRTLWSYISPISLAQATPSGSSAEISAGIASFFKDWAETHLTATIQSTAAQALGGITDFLQQLEQLDDLDLDEPSDPPVDRPNLATVSNAPLLEALIHFFTQDDWSFTKLQGEPTLQLAFQGKTDRWICIAKAREAQQQFVFYSICPVKVPKSKRRAIAEFLTRANFGTIVGNFELDLSDGEIRYKTSIDVASDRLTSNLINRLVYINVVMMDDYLPGIKAVLSGEAVEAALQQIES